MIGAAMMDREQLPRLKVRGPTGQTSIIELGEACLTIGRLPGHNDVALHPDPESLVTRYAHCRIERLGSTWWVTDGGSINGTFLLRKGAVSPVRERTPLADGDVIRILGARGTGSPRYWEILFEDPHRTRPAGEAPDRLSVEFDLVQRELFLLSGSTRQKVELRHQERLLLAHMAQRNAEAGNAPAFCTYRELMTAVWGDSFRLRAELFHLISSVRRKIARAAGDDLLVIETARGSGYRLHTGRP